MIMWSDKTKKCIRGVRGMSVLFFSVVLAVIFLAAILHPLRAQTSFPLPPIEATYYFDVTAPPGGDGLTPETAFNSIPAFFENGPGLPFDARYYEVISYTFVFASGVYTPGWINYHDTYPDAMDALFPVYEEFAIRYGNDNFPELHYTFQGAGMGKTILDSVQIIVENVPDVHLQVRDLTMMSSLPPIEGYSINPFAESLIAGSHHYIYVLSDEAGKVDARIERVQLIGQPTRYYYGAGNYCTSPTWADYIKKGQEPPDEYYALSEQRNWLVVNSYFEGFWLGGVTSQARDGHPVNCSFMTVDHNMFTDNGYIDLDGDGKASDGFALYSNNYWITTTNNIFLNNAYATFFMQEWWYNNIVTGGEIADIVYEGWHNPADDTLVVDPMLDYMYRPEPGSPAVDAGIGERDLDGSLPDIGMYGGQHARWYDRPYLLIQAQDGTGLSGEVVTVTANLVNYGRAADSYTLEMNGQTFTGTLAWNEQAAHFITVTMPATTTAVTIPLTVTYTDAESWGEVYTDTQTIVYLSNPHQMFIPLVADERDKFPPPHIPPGY